MSYDVKNISNTQVTRIDPFVDIEITLGCAVGCTHHEMVVKRYYDAVENDKGDDCHWSITFVDDVDSSLWWRMRLCWNFLFCYKSIFKFYDAVFLYEYQIKKLFWILKDADGDRSVRINFDNVGSIENDLDKSDCDFFELFSDDPSLVVAKMDGDDKYMFGFYYKFLKEIGSFWERLGRVVDFWIFDCKYFIAENEVWLTNDDIDLIISKVGADLDKGKLEVE